MKLQLLAYLLPAIGLVAGGFITTWWWRRRSNERMCRRIARDLHDNLGASLSNIIMLSGLVDREMNKPGNGQAGEFLSRIATEAEKVHDSLSDAARVLSVSYSQLGHLAALLNRHAHELLPEKGISFSLELPEALKTIVIPAVRRHDMYLILKEAIHNIMQHSAAAHASISFRADCRNLYCRIQDDGQGFNPAAHHQGAGLSNMKRRAELIHATLDIQSTPGTGCTLLLRVPLRPLWYPRRLCRAYSKSLQGFEDASGAANLAHLTVRDSAPAS